MIVKEMMTKNVITVSPEASLKEVGSLIKEKKISGLPVVTEGGTIVGIVTLTDLLNLLSRIYQWKQLEEGDEAVNLSDMFEKEKTTSKVADIMTKNVIALREDDSLDDVMKLMFDNKIHTIPVTKEGVLIGIVGKRDLIHACF